MELMLITNQEELIKAAEQAGIDEIFLDLEKIGKYERQGHLDTHISDHHISDIAKIKPLLRRSKLLVRVNPWYEQTKYEVDRCIAQGADILMLPMYRHVREVDNFIRYVNGRARVRPLLETPQALIRLDGVLNLINLSEIYIGLNDLRLGLGIEFMFELLSSGMVDYMANKIKNKKISFGFGGLARIGEGDIPAEMILAEHYRLGSNRVILSRAFRGNLGVDRLFDEIKKIREYEKQLQNWSASDFSDNHAEIVNIVDRILKA